MERRRETFYEVQIPKHSYHARNYRQTRKKHIDSKRLGEEAKQQHTTSEAKESHVLLSVISRSAS